MSISSFYDNLVEDINSDRNNQNNNNVVEENKPNSNEVDKNYYLLQEKYKDISFSFQFVLL